MICLASPLKQKFESLYPNGKFKIVRNFHLGKCQVYVDTEFRYHYWVQTGVMHQSDCDDVDAGKAAAEEAQCKRNLDGEMLVRDCIFTKRGGLITTQDISMPVTEELLHGLGWAGVRSIDNGKINEIWNKWTDKLPPSICGADAEEVDEDELSLPWGSMLGTTIVSVAFMVLGVLLAALERVAGKTVQELLGCAQPEAAEEASSKLDPSQSHNHTGPPIASASSCDPNLSQILSAVERVSAQISSLQHDQSKHKHNGLPDEQQPLPPLSPPPRFHSSGTASAALGAASAALPGTAAP
mmetsp:Transcript_35521/g.83179  ORF Transcript_35521/g.83179 Transcript_35521/m.83179 type:complete len:297 (-) Transcript_35521:121-1011(-)